MKRLTASVLVLIGACAPPPMVVVQPPKPSFQVCVAEGAGRDDDKPLSRCTKAATTTLPLLFGSIPRDHDQSRRVSLSNTGLEPLTISDISFTGSNGMYAASAYKLDPLTLPFTMPRGQTVEIAVVIDVTSLATTFATLTIHSDDPVTPTVSISVSGVMTQASQPLPIWSRAQVLDFEDVLDAKYSAALDAIVVAAYTSVEIIDVATMTTRSINLSWVSESISISPSGHEALIGTPGGVTIINLDTAKIVGFLDAKAAIFDLLHAGNGYAYVFPPTERTPPADFGFRSIELDGGHIAISHGAGIRGNTHAQLSRLEPDAIYGADSTGKLAKYTIAGGGPPTLSAEGEQSGTHSSCGRLWLAQAGLRIVTGCGALFHASATNPADDMSYSGQLENVKKVLWADDSVAAGQLAVIDETWASPIVSDQAVLIFEPSSSTAVRTDALPYYPGTYLPSHARYVFWNAAGTHYYVLAKADYRATGVYLKWSLFER